MNFKTENELHMMALSKSEDSAKIKPSMKVVKLGFVTTMLNEMQEEFKKELNNRSCESCKRRKHCNIWDDAGIPIDSLKDFWCNGYEAKGE